MRPAEFTPEEIIVAGKHLQASGKSVTGFAIRKHIGGGNPTRLRLVWDEHIAGGAEGQSSGRPDGLPDELAREVSVVAAVLVEQVGKLAAGLNSHATRLADAHVSSEIEKTQAERAKIQQEMQDAALAVESLEDQLAVAKSATRLVEAKLAESNAQVQAQSLQIVQLQERLATSEQARQADAERHSTEVGRVRDEFSKFRAQIEQMNEVYAQLEQARRQAAEAREEAALLRGQAMAIEVQRAELVRVLAERPNT